LRPSAPELDSWFSGKPLEAWHLSAGKIQVILAKGMPGKPLPQEDPPHVGVTLKPDAHQVISLALLVMRARPDARDRRNAGILSVPAPDFDGCYQVAPKGLKVIDDLEEVYPVHGT
jgi:hypothetical protein